MFDKFLRVLRAMELEEKVLHAGVAICIVGLFIPWIGGQWSGEAQQWNGFGYYTGYIGHFVFVLQVFIISITLSPLLGGPIIVRKARKNAVRLQVGIICTILLVASFSILLRMTSQVSGADIRFGIYVAIVGSVLTTLYAFLKYEEQRKSEVREIFHHPDATVKKVPTPEPEDDEGRPPPPPPPPPLQVEDHSLFKP